MLALALIASGAGITRVSTMIEHELTERVHGVTEVFLDGHPATGPSAGPSAPQSGVRAPLSRLSEGGGLDGIRAVS